MSGENACPTHSTTKIVEQQARPHRGGGILVTTLRIPGRKNASLPDASFSPLRRWRAIRQQFPRVTVFVTFKYLSASRRNKFKGMWWRHPILRIFGLLFYQYFFMHPLPYIICTLCLIAFLHFPSHYTSRGTNCLVSMVSEALNHVVGCSLLSYQILH